MKTFNLFKNKNKNLQPPKVKTKIINPSKNKNKNLQPLREKTKIISQKTRTKTFNLQNKIKKPSISKLFK
jgi:hypothetical protein